MTIDYDDHTRTESARFLAALRDADLSARVPTCPDWTGADLLYHLTEVHYFWAAIVGQRILEEAVVDDEVEAAKPAQPDDREELVALFERTTRDLLVALSTADDCEDVWTWAPDGQNVGFVRRFQAHEALFHRVDAELAAGLAVSAPPDDLVADSVDVVLRLQKTWRPGWADWQPGDEIARLEASDTGDSWTVRLGRWSGNSPDTGKTYDGELSLDVVDAGEPTVTVTAPAATLAGWLWGRPVFGDVQTSGDEAHLPAVVGYLTSGVQ